MVTILIALVVGYLLGSLPFGYLVARAKGVNIFEVGTKNPGATNVRRVLGAAGCTCSTTATNSADSDSVLRC